MPDEAKVPPRVVALAYGQDEVRQQQSPRLVAKGRGLIAEEILKRARDHGVPVCQSPELLEALIGFDLDAHVPPSLYVAVAQLLAWAFQQDQRAGERRSLTKPVP
jgi:flagellar biosynthesis protein